MILSRRRLFGFLAAPAIVRVASIMPVVALPIQAWTAVAPVTEWPPIDFAEQRAAVIKIWSQELYREALKQSFVSRFIPGALHG